MKITIIYSSVLKSFAETKIAEVSADRNLMKSWFCPHHKAFRQSNIFLAQNTSLQISRQFNN